MIDILKSIGDIIKFVIPLGAILAAVIIASKLMGWWQLFIEAIVGFFSSPGRFIYGLVIVGLFLVFFFTKIWPLILPYLDDGVIY